MPQSVLVFAEDLNGDLRIDPGDQLIVSRLNNLREIEFHTRKSFDAIAHSIDQFVFGLGGCPLLLWFEADIQFVIADALRVATQFSAANLGDDGFDLRKLAQSFLNLRRNFDRARQRDARRHRRTHKHVAFIDGRQKLAAENENIGDAPNQ